VHRKLTGLVPDRMLWAGLFVVYLITPSGRRMAAAAISASWGLRVVDNPPIRRTSEKTPSESWVTLMGPADDVERKDGMIAKELHDKTPDQLRDELVNLKKEAFNLRFQQATGQLENAARLRTVKRDVARVKTVLNMKAAAAATEA